MVSQFLSQGLNLEAAAQGMAGTQRAFFNLLAARGGATLRKVLLVR